MVGNEVSLLQALEKTGEDPDFPVPIARRPYLSEFWVKGFVELTLDVSVVGRVTRPYTEASAAVSGSGRWDSGGLKGGSEAEERGVGVGG